MIDIHLEAHNQRSTLATLAVASRTTWETLSPLLYQSVAVANRTSLTGLLSNFDHRPPGISPPSSESRIKRVPDRDGERTSSSSYDS